MTSPGKGRGQPDLDKIGSHPFTCDSGAETEDIGIIMFPAHSRSIFVVAVGGTYFPIPVGGDRHTDPGTADKNASLATAIVHQRDDTFGIVRIVYGITGKTAGICDIMVKVTQQLHDLFLEMIAAMISAKRNLH